MNSRSATACLKCGAALETVAYEMPEAAMATERVMADADRTLAALQRDLALATHARASSQGAVPASAAPAPEAQSTPSEPEPAPLVVAAAETAASVRDPEIEPVPVFGERRDDSPGEDGDVWIDPEAGPGRDERARRPRHGRSAAVVLLALVLFLTPAAFWTQRNPEQVSAWRARVAGFFNGSGSPPAQPEASPADAASAPAVATNPSSSPVTSEPPPAEAPAAPVAAEQQAPATDAAAAPATRAESTMVEVSPPAPAVTAPRESKARTRAAAKSRSTGRTARQAPRTPATKSAAAPARAAEKCTEEVAALGLCEPRGGPGRP